jgi:plastocyanin
MTVMIEGKSDGTCSPLQIELKQGQTVEFVLKAAEKMFKLDSKTLGLELMADQNGQAKQILILGNKGTYNFTCGFHGANQNSQGKIIIQ